jgi:hypothetical protein
LFRTLLAGLLLCAAVSAHAWGRDVHRLVAELSLERLTPVARAEVDRLLALEPGASLVSISTWADEVRSPSTSAWHYVNFRQGEPCEYSEALCPAGACVVAAIERQARVLASSAADDQRLKALKYAVHFVADVHQPLHAGFFEDRGGNRYQVQAFSRGTNLHALWDTGLRDNWPGGLEALTAEVRSSKAILDHTTAREWAEQSCRIVSSPEFYPVGRHVGEDYRRQWSATLTEQMARAVGRLAGLLNQALGKR